jgi:lysophospholipid acyltransferase (LPLAT)-like uncharacterized protein
MTTFRDSLIGNTLYMVSRVTSQSGRYHVRGMEHVEGMQAAGRPVIIVAWHGMTMMLAGFFLNSFDLSSLVLLLPDDWRGTNLAVWARRLGAQPFNLNLKGDSTMAAARQIAQLVRLVKQGKSCYITPDGPDGPGYVIKPGVAFIARKTGAALLPVGAYARHGYRLNRWDQYVVPYPFSRISLVIGAPLEVPSGDSDGLEAITRPLTAALHQVTAEAAANYYEQP